MTIYNAEIIYVLDSTTGEIIAQYPDKLMMWVFFNEDCVPRGGFDSMEKLQMFIDLHDEIEATGMHDGVQAQNLSGTTSGMQAWLKCNKPGYDYGIIKPTIIYPETLITKLKNIVFPPRRIRPEPYGGPSNKEIHGVGGPITPRRR